MNRRDFLKSTAALATVAVAGKAIGKAVEPEPPIADWSEATRRLAKTDAFNRSPLGATFDGVEWSFDRPVLTGKYPNGNTWVCDPWSDK